MFPLAQTDGVALVWSREGFRGDWELKWGAEKIGHLLAVPERKGFGEAGTGEEAWVFFERGTWKRRTFLATREGLELGSFKPDGIKGTLEMADGRRLLWEAPDQWEREWGFSAGGEQLFRMVRDPRIAGSAHVPTDARVDVNPRYLREPALPLVLLFGGYLFATRPLVEKFKPEKVREPSWNLDEV